jgi:hypothetical protein
VLCGLHRNSGTGRHTLLNISSRPLQREEIVIEYVTESLCQPVSVHKLFFVRLTSRRRFGRDGGAILEDVNSIAEALVKLGFGALESL